MASTFTTLLRLNKPALGDAGWGTAVNGGFTDLADSAIAGTTTLNTDADVTLTTANGAADQARQMILNCTGARTAERTITAPAESKVYVIINGTSGGHGVRIAGVLPPTTTGVLVPAGRMAVVAWNGSDFVTLGAVVDLTASGNVSFDGGTFVFNESGADKDARFEGDTDANLLFLDASTDRVGIGTATPAAKLDVNGPASVTSFTGATRLGVTVKGSTTATDYSGIDFSGNNQIVPTARIAVLTESGGSSLVFGTSNNYATGITNSALVIDFSGNVGIGTATPGKKLEVDGVVLCTNTNGLAIRSSLGTSNDVVTLDASNVLIIGGGGATDSIQFWSSGSERMRIDSSGNLLCQGVYDNTTGSAANVFVASNGLLQRSTSSLKYKTDVQDATHGLTEVMRLRPVTYKGKNDGDKVFGGLIAEEVHAVGLTEFVSYNDDSEPDALHYGNMVALLTKAVQEQQTLIDALTDRVAALEAK